MQIISVFLIVQILLAGIILNFNTQSTQASLVKHAVKGVLGTSFLADDTLNTDQTQSDTISQQPTSPTSDNNSSDQSTLPTGSIDQPSPTVHSENNPSSEEVFPNQQENSGNQPSNASTDSNITATPVGFSPDESTVHGVTPTETPSAEQSQQITSQGNTQDTINLSENSPTNNLPSLNTSASDALSISASNAITSPDSIVSNPQMINEQTMQKTQQEEQVLKTVKTPQQQENTLLSFAGDKVSNIDNMLKHDDLSTTSFVTQRLTDQLNQIGKNLTLIPVNQYAQIKRNIQSFCNKADLILKTEQVSVPEDMEQDIIIARGKCFDITQ